MTNPVSSGYVPCPPAFLKHLRQVCDKHGILLVIDEVQTGFYRTGTYFATEHVPGLRADIMVFAKGVANGFPISGIVSNKSLMQKLDVGSMGGTYAGNAVACAAGVAAQDVFATEDIAGNVKKRSEQLYKALNDMATSPKTGHLITQVRGQGVSPPPRLGSMTCACVTITCPSADLWTCSSSCLLWNSVYLQTHSLTKVFNPTPTSHPTLANASKNTVSNVDC